MENGGEDQCKLLQGVFRKKKKTDLHEKYSIRRFRANFSIKVKKTRIQECSSSERYAAEQLVTLDVRFAAAFNGSAGNWVTGGR